MSGVVQLEAITTFLDDYLNIAEIPDYPNAVNGLQVQNSGTCGNFAIQVDLSALPVNPAIPAFPGDSWNFQCWFRDVGGTNNLTDGIEVTFE